MDHAFGSRRPYGLGMEEELLLVDPRTHALAHVAPEVVPRVAVPEDGCEVKYDVYSALVELASPPVDTATRGGEALHRLRDAVRAAGGTVVGCGIHPDGAFGDVEHVDEPRYQDIGRQLRGLLRRTPTCALHVHVGMPDPETCVRACNRMREHLPLLQALAANSPFWHGRESGFMTARAQLFRGYPRAIVPRTFASWDEYATVVGAAVAAAEVADYTFLYWDIRPHPRLGTLEVRAMDAQASVADATGLAALVHALCIAAATDGGPAFDEPWEAVMESSFRAGRDGLDATVLWRGERRGLRDVARRTLDEARAHAPDAGALEQVERLLRDGTGAERMRADHARGGMPAALAGLVSAAA